MDGFFATLGYGLAALLALATLVAAWEAWRHSRQTLRLLHVPAPTNAASVDVDLERLVAPSSAGDQSARQATLSAAMAGMAGAPAAAQAPWIETRPMVGLGVAAETDTR